MRPLTWCLKGFWSLGFVRLVRGSLDADGEVVEVVESLAAADQLAVACQPGAVDLGVRDASFPVAVHGEAGLAQPHGGAEVETPDTT